MDFLLQHLPGLCKTPGIQGRTQIAVSFLMSLPCSVPTYCKITPLCAVELIPLCAVELKQWRKYWISKMGPRASLWQQSKCFNLKAGYSGARLRITICFTVGKESNKNICEETLCDAWNTCIPEELKLCLLLESQSTLLFLVSGFFLWRCLKERQKISKVPFHLIPYPFPVIIICYFLVLWLIRET